MSNLNCGVGDLAITVNCDVPANLGTIVLVKSAAGMKRWGPDKTELFSWDVEVATENGYLVYEYETHSETVKSGAVPDKCLRRITPPKGYLMEEFADAEPVQMNLHLIDL
jgi:hypothetical protein